MQEVYDLIMNDLNNAVRYLKGAKRIDKGYIDQSVAYGLRARVNLVYEQLGSSCKDADSALILSGAVPIS